MTRRKTIVVVALTLYAAASIAKADVIAASVVSLLLFCGLHFTEVASPPLRTELLEFWIAGVVWLLCGAFLVRQVLKARGGSISKRYPTAVVLLSIIVVCAIVAPLIVPLPPNAQGNLMTTRLRPPLSLGTMVRMPDAQPPREPRTTLAQAYAKANALLVDRSIQFSSAGDAEREHDAETRGVVFLFGTDDNARDVFSRVVYGARVSLAIGFAAACGALLIGFLIGFVAGYSTRLIDSALMRFTDLVLAIPSLFLVVAIMAFLDKSVATLIVVLSLTGWMGVARTVRTEVMRLRTMEFILAAKLLNVGTWRICWKHILPNLRPVLITAATLQFGNAVLAEASLSFLGLGVQPPTASWGNMLGQSLSYLHTGWWLAVFPGVLLSSVLIAAHYAVAGESAR
jgi:peptide/nickel transport system permease protein